VSSLTGTGLAAVEQFAARWVFDAEEPAEMQRDLAQHIERALADFKATELQDLVARTLRNALRQRVIEAIESWHRANSYAQPVAQAEETAA
jgi:hypothetical protein